MNEQFAVSEVVFIRDQNGEAERNLKAALVPLLGKAGVDTAYLAIVLYGSSSEWHVALCVSGAVNSRAELAEGIGKIFASQFRSDVHLDIIFLSDAQQIEIQKVCKAFFTSETRK